MSELTTSPPATLGESSPTPAAATVPPHASATAETAGVRGQKSAAAGATSSAKQASSTKRGKRPAPAPAPLTEPGGIVLPPHMAQMVSGDVRGQEPPLEGLVLCGQAAVLITYDAQGRPVTHDLDLGDWLLLRWATRPGAPVLSRSLAFIRDDAMPPHNDPERSHEDLHGETGHPTPG